MKEIEKEKVIGKIHNFYSKLLVITLKPSCALKIGDSIRIRGKGVDFIQKIKSMELNHKQVNRADVGDFIGIKVDNEEARKGCTVYLLVG